jgi:hypothetical protein
MLVVEIPARAGADLEDFHKPPDRGVAFFMPLHGRQQDPVHYFKISFFYLFVLFAFIMPLHGNSRTLYTVLLFVYFFIYFVCLFVCLF